MLGYLVDDAGRPGLGLVVVDVVVWCIRLERGGGHLRFNSAGAALPSIAAPFRLQRRPPSVHHCRRLTCAANGSLSMGYVIAIWA